MGLLFIVFVSSLLSSWILNPSTINDWASSFLQNFSTEVLGAIATFGLFELVLGSQKEAKNKAEAEEAEKQSLIEELPSGSRATVVRA